MTKKYDWREKTYTAQELVQRDFPDVVYTVKGLIPEGLTILAGKPKIGKSWMALDFATCVPQGGECLGGFETRAGDVLYCALEDNPRRLQDRILKIGGYWITGYWSERVTLAHDWRRLDDGGVDDIADWIDSVEAPRLVILDTLAGVRPERSQRDTQYDGDYAALIKAHKLANERSVSILVLTHQRKMDADDPIDTVSGTLGLTGCADNVLVLARGSQGTTLYVRGRDIEEAEHAITFNKATRRWTILGEAAEVRKSDARKAIIEAIRAGNDTPDLIATATGLNRNAINQRLIPMLRDGDVVKLARGKYGLPEQI